MNLKEYADLLLTAVQNVTKKDPQKFLNSLNKEQQQFLVDIIEASYSIPDELKHAEVDTKNDGKFLN